MLGVPAITAPKFTILSVKLIHKADTAYKMSLQSYDSSLEAVEAVVIDIMLFRLCI
ncbi:hypothetical protein LIA77_00011 [Sarocladium implicatum]|nr:hypothetical protein LIA77_00011 [Sarocladium implicatum]